MALSWSFALLAFLSASPSSPPVFDRDVVRSNVDFKVDPGMDFFSYANGGWIKRNPIPNAESSWGIGSLIQLELFGRLRKINESAAKEGGPAGSPGQQVGDYWATAMDEGKAEKVGLMPLKPLLDRIDKVTDAQGAVQAAFDLEPYGLGLFFSEGIRQDDKDSDVMAVTLGQGGLGLPDRDFYFNADKSVSKIRDEYVLYIGKLLELIGSHDAGATAKRVMAFETSLAEASRKLEDLRDPEKNYNKMAPGDVTSKLTPTIDWAKHYDSWHISPSYVLVGQPEFYSSLEKILAKTDVGTLRDYMRAQVVGQFAPYLNKAAVQLDFHFNHEVMAGQKAMKPRWKRVLGSENGPLGFLVGKLFVHDFFPESEKKRYSDLVEAVRQSFSERIDRLDWMSPETKAKAHEKLAAIRKKVGYPDKWKDYSKLVINRNSYCENVMNVAKWGFEDELSKYGKPVDRDEWGITPQTFNAYYDPSNNEIVLPAAAFAVPGVKDSDMDDAVVYGNMAASWIGHEMTHGFDDQGRQYDAQGNLSNWWTKEDADNFTKRAELMVKQFDGFEAVPGLHVNGKATLGENIADFGGLLIGLDAFKKTKQYQEGKPVAGLTPMQRFFLGYCISWLENTREEVIRRNAMSDVHAPAKWRVNGPLSNMPEFYEAFGIKEGQPMWRPADQRVHIW